MVTNAIVFMTLGINFAFGGWLMTEFDPGRHQQYTRPKLKRETMESSLHRIRRAPNLTIDEERETYWTHDTYPSLPSDKQMCAGNRTGLGNVERICDPDGVLPSNQVISLETFLQLFYHRSKASGRKFCLCYYLEFESCDGFYIFSPLIGIAKRIKHRYDEVYEKETYWFARDFDSNSRAFEMNSRCGNTLTIFLSVLDKEIAFVYGDAFFQVYSGYHERLIRNKVIDILEDGNEIFWALDYYFDKLSYLPNQLPNEIVRTLAP